MRNDLFVLAIHASEMRRRRLALARSFTWRMVFGGSLPSGEDTMHMIRSAMLSALFCLMLTGSIVATAQDSPARSELKRADLSGANGMEVISSIVEVQPGTEVQLHFHHGVETAYVLQGTMIQPPGKAPVMVETGSSLLNLRDVPHGGYKVVGDKPLRLFTVHIVDKGKPLYEYVK